MRNKPQLFCFSYAGGNAGFFDEIEKDMEGIDVVRCEYAGHGGRHSETFYKDFDELADDMFRELKARYTGGKYALFGYSMGSISLVETLRRILDEKMVEPTHVFLAAHEPHTKSELSGFTADELDEWVKDRTLSFGAVPEKLVKNQTFWRMYLPIYRADYTIIGRYEFEKLNLRTEIPAVVFYSETDTPEKEMKQWEKYFVGECDLYRFTGTHFFIRQYHKEMARIISKKMGAEHDI